MNINWDILGLKKKQIEPVKGDLLIAEPFLNEIFFERAVICLVEHGTDKSTLGIVLNHRTQFTLNEAIPGIETKEEIPLFCGGPMSGDRLFYIHTLNKIIPNSIEILPGLYINGDLRIVKSYINAGQPIKGYIRFFVGYSGWTEGQLSAEIEEHTWGVTKPDTNNLSKYLLSNGNSYWRERVEEMGIDYRTWLMCPTIPILN